MNQENKAALRQQMGEVACLPASDEARLSVEELVVAAGAWAEREWLDLLREDEALRLELRRVSTPPGLRERLLKIPTDAAAITKPNPIQRIFPWLLLAAAALALLIAGANFWPGTDPVPMPQAIDPVTQFVVVAMDHHARNLTLSAAEQNTHGADLSQQLSTATGLEVVLPAALQDEAYHLLGGHTCSSCRIPVAVSLWQRAHGAQPLLQFDPAKLGLGANETRPPVCIPGMQKATGLCDVIIWSENGRGYAFAVPHGQSLPALSSASTTAHAHPLWSIVASTIAP